MATTLIPKTITAKEVDRWQPPYERSPIAVGDISNSVVHIRELFDHVINARTANPETTYGHPTQCWPVFARAFGGLRPGELTVVTAETGAGKTTFALNWAADYARPGTNGVFYVSLEMSKQATAEKLAQLIHRKPVREFDQGTNFTDLRAVREVFDRLNFWFFDHYGRVKTDRLFKAIWYAVCEKKTRLVVIDHLAYLVHQDRAENQTIAVENTMRDLALVANQTGSTILLVVHPRKGTPDEKRRPLELDDLKGSSAISQEASNVLSLFRPDRTKSETYLFFLKIRSHHFAHSLGGGIRFNFNPRSLWLEEESKEIEFRGGRNHGV
ncbi:MAG: DnaB-like helicase C-terminal domain-containing protein [Pseudomonadota bacterium]